MILIVLLVLYSTVRTDFVISPSRHQSNVEFTLIFSLDVPMLLNMLLSTTGFTVVKQVSDSSSYFKL